MVGPEIGLSSGLPASALIVLRRAVSRFVRLYPPPIKAEGCRTFGSVKRSDAATIASTEVVQSAARTQTGKDLVDRSCDLGDLTLDGIKCVAILAMDHSQQIEGGERVKLVREGMRVLAHGVGQPAREFNSRRGPVPRPRQYWPSNSTDPITGHQDPWFSETVFRS